MSPSPSCRWPSESCSGVLHDDRAVDRAVRHLVNLGRMSVTSGGRDALVFGPDHPVPDDLPDEEFERLFIL